MLHLHWDSKLAFFGCWQTYHILCDIIVTNNSNKKIGITSIFKLLNCSLFFTCNVIDKIFFRPISECRAKQYMFQIVKGVDHIHHHGIFHRDLKPENILVKVSSKYDCSRLPSIYYNLPRTQ